MSLELNIKIDDSKEDMVEMKMSLDGVFAHVDVPDILANIGAALIGKIVEDGCAFPPAFLAHIVAQNTLEILEKEGIDTDPSDDLYRVLQDFLGSNNEGGMVN